MGLIGRDAELDAVSGVLADARAGRSRVLALVGEAGIGKSALLAYAEDEAVGMSVLRARGVQSEAQIPFAALSELLRPTLGILDRIPRPQAAALEGALALTLPHSEDRFAVGAATLSLLAGWAEQRPVLVLVDDAHWIDGSSADAMSFAFRRLLADPIAVLIAARTDEPSLLDRSDLPRLHLRGLDAAASSGLVTVVTGPISDELDRRVHQQTGGNPLALLEAAREIDCAHPSVPLDTPLPIVTSISEIYAKRIRTLPAPSQTVLLLGAAGDIPELSLIGRAAAGIGLALADLAPAEESGLVRLSGGRLEFAHPLIRAAVYNEATAEQCRQAHRALADVLPDAEMERRAWHLCLATVGPNDATCSALEQAATRCRDRNAYEVASTTFERAAQMTSDENRRSQLLHQAAETAWSGGQVLRAVDLLDQTRLIVLLPDVAIAVEQLRGHIATRLGPVADGLAILSAAAGYAADIDPERAVIILAEVVHAGFYAGDTEAMRLAAEQIAAIQNPKMSIRVTFFGTMARGMAMTFTGDADEGAVHLRRAVNIVSRNYELTDDANLLTWAAMGPLWLRDNDIGRALIERATDAARGRVAIGVLPYLLCHVAIDQAATDHWPEAEAAFYEVIGLARESRQRTDLAAALARLAWLEARQGKERACLEHAAEASALADELGLKLCHIWALAAIGELQLAQGRIDDALTQFNQQQAILDACGINDVDLSPAPELVDCQVRRSNISLATNLAMVYSRQAAKKGQPWAMARAARCRGLVAEDGAVDAIFTEALDEHARTPDTFELARTHLAYGSRLRRAGQRTRGRQQIRSAVDLFDALGAEPWSSIARNELAATGETARKRDVSARTQLTPQELQIAVRLAARQTTRQVAAALFLSPKTVEYHLSSIYRKLGCNNRQDLATAMDRLSSLGPASR